VSRHDIEEWEALKRRVQDAERAHRAAEGAAAREREQADKEEARATDWMRAYRAAQFRADRLEAALRDILADDPGQCSCPEAHPSGLCWCCRARAALRGEEGPNG
jgi:hypothetical protein